MEIFSDHHMKVSLKCFSLIISSYRVIQVYIMYNCIPIIYAGLKKNIIKAFEIQNTKYWQF